MTSQDGTVGVPLRGHPLTLWPRGLGRTQIETLPKRYDAPCDGHTGSVVYSEAGWVYTSGNVSFDLYNAKHMNKCHVLGIVFTICCNCPGS